MRIFVGFLLLNAIYLPLFMAFLTKREFSMACGMETNQLAVNIKRGEVIVKDKYIDTDDPTNAAFMEKRVAKGKVKQLTQIGLAAQPVVPKDPSIPSYEESEQRVKYFDALKREKEVEKLQLDIQKKRGEVIPSELIPPVILQHNQSIITAMKNEFDDWLRNHAKKYDLGTNEIAEIRTQAVGWINNGMTKATAMSVRAVENIVRDYQEKRGVGERL